MGPFPGWSIKVVSNYAFGTSILAHGGTTLTQIRRRQNNSRRATAETQPLATIREHFRIEY